MLLGKSELLLFIFLFRLVLLSAKVFHPTNTKYLHVVFDKSRNGHRCRFCPQARPGSLAAFEHFLHSTSPEPTPDLYWDQLNRESSSLLFGLQGFGFAFFFFNSLMFFVGFVFYGFYFFIISFHGTICAYPSV